MPELRMAVPRRCVSVTVQITEMKEGISRCARQKTTTGHAALLLAVTMVAEYVETTSLPAVRTATR